MSETDDRGRGQAEAQLSSIIEMVAALNCDYDRLEELRDTDADELTDEEREELKELEDEAGDCTDSEDARQRIEEDALSVEVRSGWVSPGESMTADEFSILLCTGGPACRIRGELDQYGQPDRAWMEYQDWFTSWTELVLTGSDADAILDYCRVFYFGED